MSICANSKGESAHLHRLTLVFVKEPKSHVMPKMVICVLLTLAAKTLLCVHISAGWHEPYSHSTM